MLKSVNDIRSELLENLSRAFPDWIWTTGEPLVDILDSVAELIYQREFLEDLINKLRSLSGFEILLKDEQYRKQIADVLKLSLTKRTKSWLNVPDVVKNDIDAMVWYYLDRYAEKRGYKRKSGVAAHGLGRFYYPVVTGDVFILFQRAGLFYKATLERKLAKEENGKLFLTATIKAIGYGEEYNTKANTLGVYNVGGAITDSSLITFTHEDIVGGSGYQGNMEFLNELKRYENDTFSVNTTSNLSRIMGSISSIDKYAITNMLPKFEFTGATCVWIKSNSSQVIYYDKIVPIDNKLLIPYQPSKLLSLTVDGVNMVEGVDYSLQNDTDSWKNSTRDIVYIVFTSDQTHKSARLELMLDNGVLTADRYVNSIFAEAKSIANDVIFYKALPVYVDVKLKLGLNYYVSTVESLVESKLSSYIDSLPIEDGKGIAKLESSDLISELYKISTKQGILVDNVMDIEVVVYDDNGILKAWNNLDGYIPEIGHYFELRNVTVELDV